MIINTMAGQSGRPVFYEQSDMNASSRNPMHATMGRSFQIDKRGPVPARVPMKDMVLSSKLQDEETNAQDSTTVALDNLPKNEALVDQQMHSQNRDDDDIADRNRVADVIYQPASSKRPPVKTLFD